jgi:hypothetical protein
MGPLRGQHVMKTDLHARQEPVDSVIEGRHIDFVDEPDLQMILQVLADAIQRMAHLDTGILQHLALADPRELQNLWRADGTGRQDHLATLAQPDRLALAFALM